MKKNSRNIILATSLIIFVGILSLHLVKNKNNENINNTAPTYRIYNTDIKENRQNNLNIKLENFKEDFNSISKELALEVNIDKMNIDKDTFNSKIKEGYSLEGNIDNDNISKVSLNANCKEPLEVLRSSLIMETLMSISSPNVKMEDRIKYLKEIGYPEDDKTLKEGTKSIKIGELTYTLTVNPDRNIIFTIQ